jgi:hypothetical protein
VEATTCVSAEELRSLVASAPISLAIVEAGLPGVDRALVDEVRRSGTALAVVDGPALAAAVGRLEPDAVLPPDFDHDALAAVLATHLRRRRPVEPTTSPVDDVTTARLVAVTGARGTGVSTVAQALATGLAGAGPTLLADLALDADQHVRHGLPPGGDGVFELAEALRHAPPEAVLPPAEPVAGGYDLLCGLRRRREWVTLDDALAGQLVATLRRERAHVVAEVDGELDGQAETGSVDVEERNALARRVVGTADVVAVVGRWSTTGVPRLARLLVEIEAHGVPRARLRPVLNGAPRSSAGRVAAARALQKLLGEGGRGPWPLPIAVGHDRRVERHLREGRGLPNRIVRQAAAVLETS